MSRLAIRWLIATFAGGVTVFVCGGLSHLVLLKGAGFSQTRNGSFQHFGHHCLEMGCISCRTLI